MFTKIFLMSALPLQAYDMLKQKLGDQEAKLFISFLESEVKQELNLKTKTLVTKKDLTSAISEVKSDLTRPICIVVLIQFLAIVSSVIGIMAFMLHK